MEANTTVELKSLSLANKGTPTPNYKPIRSPWNKFLEEEEVHHQSKKLSNRGHIMKRRRVITKNQLRRVRLPQREGKDRGIKTRVRTLNSLIPNQEPKDLEGLFRVTAEYILGLQTRVRVMQMMVDSLTTGSNE